MGEQQVNLPVVPVAQVVRSGVGPHAQAFWCALHDAPQVVLVGVEAEHRRRRPLHELHQHLQLRRVDLHLAALLVVDAPVGILRQLVDQRRRRRRRHRRDLVLCLGFSRGRPQQGDALFHEAAIPLVSLGPDAHLHVVMLDARQLQIVRCLHREADVRDLRRDRLFGPLLRPHLDRDVVLLDAVEVRLAVARHERPQALALVEAVDLRPEVYQPVGCRGAGQADDPRDCRQHLAQGLEALRLRRLEARQLVEHHHVEARPLARLERLEPDHRVAPQDIDVGLLAQGGEPLRRRPRHHRHPQIEMRPAGRLVTPRGLGHLLRRDHEHGPDLHPVHERLHRRQRAYRLAEAHLHEQPAARMVEHPPDGAPLVVVRLKPPLLHLPLPFPV